MAIVQNPVIGRARKKLANVVFTTVLNQNVVKSKPLTVANPRTFLQRKARKRLENASKFAKVASATIQQSFKEAAVNMYPRNKFISVNYDVFTVDNQLEETTNFVNVLVSMGNNTQPAINLTATLENGNLTIEYTPGAGNTAETCKLIACVYVKSKNLFIMMSDSTLWNAGTLVIEDVSLTSNDIIYIFSYDTVTQKYSDSVGVNVNVI